MWKLRVFFHINGFMHIDTLPSHTMISLPPVRRIVLEIIVGYNKAFLSVGVVLSRPYSPLFVCLVG